jgi:hypothetical protein
MNYKLFKKSTSILTIIAYAFVFVGVGYLSMGSGGIQHAYAAQLANVSDTLSNPTATALSNHTIVFTTPTGITAGQQVVITFTGYANLSSLASTSIDVLVGNSTTTATNVNVAASNGSSIWGVSTSTNVLTLTAPSSGSLPTAGQVVEILVGTNATFQVQGTQQLTNPAAGSYLLTIGGTQADSGTFTLAIVANAVVTMTATVAQTISFAILSSTSTAFSNTIYFGNLSTVAFKMASSTNTAGDTASTTAHVLTVSTNAPNGYSIVLRGDTLRNQNATTTFIAPIGATASSSISGTNQFGINVVAAGGTGAVVSGSYGVTNKFAYNASSTVADTLAFGPVPTTTTTLSLAYLANISAVQAAGLYSTSITYVGTANF